MSLPTEALEAIIADPDSPEVVRAMATELKEARRLLAKAVQLGEVATDWNLYEVEIDGKMVSTYELYAEFRNFLTEGATHGR